MSRNWCSKCSNQKIFILTDYRQQKSYGKLINLFSIKNWKFRIFIRRHKLCHKVYIYKCVNLNPGTARLDGICVTQNPGTAGPSQDLPGFLSRIVEICCPAGFLYRDFPADNVPQDCSMPFSPGPDTGDLRDQDRDPGTTAHPWLYHPF